MKNWKETYDKMYKNGSLGMLIFFGSVAIIFILLKLFVFKS
jgi:hypothetical protein